jgi:hypothetical protein
VALSAKNVPDTVQELWDLLVAYAKQETVDPLRNLGRFVGYGLAGMALLTLGTFLLGLALLRFIQTMTGDWADGFWSWVPYLPTVVFYGAVIGVAVSRIGKGGLGTPAPTAETRTAP